MSDATDKPETVAEISALLRRIAASKYEGHECCIPCVEIEGIADRLDAAAERERIERDKVSFRCGDCAEFGRDCDAWDVDGNEDCIACEKFVRRHARGDAAALREALIKMLDFCCSLCAVPDQMADMGHSCDWKHRWAGCNSEAITAARSALAAPARNCDRYETYSLAWKAYRESDAWRYDGITFAGWLFAKEGGAE